MQNVTGEGLSNNGSLKCMAYYLRIDVDIQFKLENRPLEIYINMPFTTSNLRPC